MMSSRGDGPVAPPTAMRVGADLREARERLGWTIPALAAHLRIRLPYLEALEDGRIQDLPGRAYALGFVRTYAQTLGLDPDEVGRRFRAEAADVNRKTELAFPAPVPERGVPAGAVVALGVLLAIGAYAGWYHMSGTDRPTGELVQAVPPRLEKLIEPPPAPVPPGASASASASASVPVPAPVMPTQLAPVVPGPVLSLNSASAAIAPPHEVPAAAAPPPVAASGDGGRILLRARSDAWVQVRDRLGPILLNRIMRNGETWPVPAKGQLLLTTGNAGGTELLVDGVVTASLGADGLVRRDLPLDADQIRDGKLAAAAKPTAPVRQP
jgi:cytoskeleton protein RodZ